MVYPELYPVGMENINEKAIWNEVNSLEQTKRGTGGFGSTGIN